MSENEDEGNENNGTEHGENGAPEHGDGQDRPTQDQTDGQPQGQPQGQPPQGQPPQGQPQGQPPQGQPPQGQPQGQPPQGQPQGQPPQGQPQGQPPQGQPQGQPPQGQPQGQPPQQGHPPGAAGQQRGKSQIAGVDQQLLQDWTVFTGSLFAIAGAGVGLMLILVNVLDVQVLAADSSGGLGTGFAAALLTPLVFMFPTVAVSISSFVGAAIARQSDEDSQTVFKLTAVAVGVGSLIYYIVSVLMFSTTLDGISLEFGGLILSAVIVAIAAAAVGVGGNWAVRNQLPRGE